mmetsp:Transcript_27707/g.87543  ORF Transcript_27707/g.87543 Transcript_27707/m.87543 type:complete len:206 (-) Transcript_27707:105-722(-)
MPVRTLKESSMSSCPCASFRACLYASSTNSSAAPPSSSAQASSRQALPSARPRPALRANSRMRSKAACASACWPARRAHKPWVRASPTSPSSSSRGCCGSGAAVAGAGLVATGSARLAGGLLKKPFARPPSFFAAGRRFADRSDPAPAAVAGRPLSASPAAGSAGSSPKSPQTEAELPLRSGAAAPRPRRPPAAVAGRPKSSSHG